MRKKGLIELQKTPLKSRMNFKKRKRNLKKLKIHLRMLLQERLRMMNNLLLVKVHTPTHTCQSFDSSE